MPGTKIRVAHVITMLELGGAQGNTLFTVEHLDRSRFQVSLICGPGGLQDERARRIPQLRLDFVPSLIRAVRPWKDLSALIHLTRILKRDRPHVLHTHSSKAGILGRIAGRLAGVPVILHSIHGFGFNPYQRFFVRAFFVWLEIWIARFTRRLIAVSQENIELGLRLGIGRRQQYRLIRSGVDVARVRERARACDREALRRAFGIPPGHKVVLSVGPLKPQKDPVAFVRLAAKVVAAYSPVRFLWLGDGELRPRVEDEASRLGVSGSLRIAGWSDQVPEMLSLADVLVMTSLWEGLPRASLEALVAGKPVAAFRVDGIPEVVRDGENGFLFQPGDLESFASKLVLLLKDEALYRRLAERAKDTVDNTFDIHTMVRQQEELYEEEIRGHY